ncbi:TraR/DksA C4-type zinc finger protein [Litchfieldia salsa]|uniref:RNA polymerase-binding transcription factor DksA n=1 Tax=Litchfieldia salsa TaxID=930152 RepID=A0A1H0RDQ8_9BACI|nr:TraR/DksA C4-type zinc finger protein [Litchfieldia salsa]SDP27319.1 RNA polymerase-binding transcription factor DksA [Litchfieldia salsa]
MNDQYAEIKAELELTKKELIKRLSNTTNMEVSYELLFDDSSNEKEKMLIHHIKEDLQDVERALGKLEYGSFGICEDTGQQIPLDKLKILPTARTIYDFSFSDLFEKRQFTSSLHLTISTPVSPY